MAEANSNLLANHIDTLNRFWWETAGFYTVFLRDPAAVRAPRCSTVLDTEYNKHRGLGKIGGEEEQSLGMNTEGEGWS